MTHLDRGVRATEAPRGRLLSNACSEEIAGAKRGDDFAAGCSGEARTMSTSPCSIT